MLITSTKNTEKRFSQDLAIIITVTDHTQDIFFTTSIMGIT